MSLGRPFRILWGANAASNLADGVAFVSIPLLAASFTDDPRWIAGLATVYALVRLVVAVPVGVWVDRLDRRAILGVSNLMRGIAIVALALCVQLGLASLVLLYIAVAVIGTLESAADNASLALVPNVVGGSDLDRANGRLAAAQLVADEFAGPPLGGLLFAVAAAAPFFAMGGLWAVAGMLALALPVRRAPAAPADGPRPSLVAEAAAGMRWLRHHRLVGGLALIGGLASVGYMLPFSILVLFAQQRLGLDAAGYGVILAVSALGGLLGTAIAGPLRSAIGYRWTIIASLLTGAVALIALAPSQNAVGAAALLAAYIAHAVVWGICAASLRQRWTPDALRGRVTAASRVIGLLGLALGSLLGGLLGAIDIALPVLVGGLVFVVCAAMAAVFIREIDAAEHPEA